MTNDTTRTASEYLECEIESGEKTMTCPVSGREYRVTRWASRGDSVVALEKEPVEGAVATDGGAELGVVCDVDDCETRIVGFEDGWEMSRGTVCQDCIDYQSRHGHWPDESVDICAECRIDDGMVPHECEESAADRVLIEPGSSCDYCGFEAAMTDGGQSIPREERVDQFGERFVQHSEWSAEERDRVREVVDDILAAAVERDDVELAKAHTSVSQTGKHDAGFDLKIAGEPWEYHDEDAEETVHKCGSCERVYGEPHLLDRGPRKAEVCPHCGTPVQDEDTEVRTVAF